jgi:excisionase family DNA binding protein
VQEQERLSLREAADALGVYEVTARRWVKSGKLKAYQPGRKYLIPRSAIDALLESESGKVHAPSSQEKLFNNGVLEEVRRGATLRSQINFVNNLADYVEQEVEEREQELKSKTSLNRKIKRNTNANWALAMMHVAAELSIAFVEDPNMKDLAYDTGEVVELYRAHRRLDTAIEPTRVWFGNEEPTNVSEIEAYRRTRQARDQMMERRRSAGA